ncbi:lysylphosphatidylglycerol synthase domain-containing protein [Naasia lichenicola]|uniref:Protein kinase domain-containing protein n=1 Tax=Naasia lichenicola TaxID=2565933 RepID=A0A4S4FKZ4_9MICO|nr:lysylphosphatidylglycerol synthase domain-containing protein [Naasia lichenicola]THG30838.1 hypothetical protein E6C64_09385 [Naasia lichenicola]
MIERFGRTRLVLLGLGAIGIAVFAALARAPLAEIFEMLAELSATTLWLTAGSALVLLVGHLFRAARTKIPLDNVRRGSLGAQFQALSVGYFFDIVLPFRIGEIIRAFLIARKLRMSILYTLAAVLVERLIDAILVSTVFLVLAAFLLEGVRLLSIGIAVLALTVSVVALFLFVRFVGEDRTLLRIVWRGTALLNPRIEAQARFRIWGVLFGFQRLLLHRRRLALYAAFSAASWICYFGATALLVAAFLGVGSGANPVVAAVAPYVGSLSAWIADPANFVETVVGTLGLVPVGATESVAAFAGAAFVVLNLPIAAIGLIMLFLVTTKPTLEHGEVTQTTSFENKLVRVEDISQTMPHFLDSYFQGERLSQVVHRLEVSGRLQLVKFFKGGSNALTVLAQTPEGRYVKKLVPSEYEHRLRNQYDWLVERDGNPQLVRALREERNEDFYAIDLEYRPASGPLFDYVHQAALETAIEKIDDVWAFMHREIYTLEKEASRPEIRDEYVEERLISRVAAAALVHEDLQRALGSPQIVVNGKTLDNFAQVMRRIQDHPDAWPDLAVYRESAAIHGDLTIDNILVDAAVDDILIIDPSDDNQIRGPIIDFARHMQSLRFGYEFLNADESAVPLEQDPTGLPSVSYRNARSSRYADLTEHMQTELMPRYLSAAEQRAVLFHVGLFYARMLTHRVVINPATVLKYYAVAVEALNQFIEQYPSEDDA